MFDHFSSDPVVAAGQIRQQELLRSAQENRLAAQLMQMQRPQIGTFWQRWQARLTGHHHARKQVDPQPESGGEQALVAA